MEKTLIKLKERWGGVLPYLEQIGVTKETITKIQDRLLVPIRSLL